MTNEYIITDFGVTCDIDEPQTEKIQAVLDLCFTNGGGTVIIPKGSFKTGGIRLRSNTTLYLKSGARLIGNRNPEDYNILSKDTLEPLNDADRYDDYWIPRYMRTQNGQSNTDFFKFAGSRWNNALIRALHAENVSIIGEADSFIDGADCFDEHGEEFYRGPHAISIHHCSNIKLSGYTVENSANWAHNIKSCENIQCSNVTAIAGHDGIHISACSNIKITNCAFYTGDDCVSGFANINVTVSDCVLNSACNAIRFGGTNVIFKNCHIFGPGKYLFRGSLTDEEKRSGAPTKTEFGNHRKNLLSAFTYYADHSMEIAERPSNILITDCVIENADRFLHFNYSGNEPWQQNRPLGDITFKNIKAKGIKMPLTAYGDTEDKFTLTLQNVDISDSPEFTAPSLINAANFDTLLLKNVSLTNIPCTSLVKRWSNDDNIIFDNVKCDIAECDRIKDADESFICGAI